METKWMLLGIVIFTIALMNYKMKEEFLDLGMGGALGITYNNCFKLIRKRIE